MKKKINELFAGWKERKQKQQKDNATYEAGMRIHYGDVEGVPYLFNNNVPMYRISNEPTDLVAQVVNIQDACKVIKNHREAFINAQIV